MKLKSLILGLFLGAIGTVHAANIHTHPQATDADKKVSTAQSSKVTNFCGISIINDSAYTVHVSGVFDDNTRLDDFDVYPYETPQFIDLVYYGYCHSYMYLRIQSNVYPYYILHDGQTPAGTTVRILNSLANTIKAETTHK
jgi:hypothetical protein